MIAIIDYQAGNTRSLQDALYRLGAESRITSNMKEIQDATRVILPGVGQAFAASMHLAKSGLINHIPKLTQPVLGICLGMQLLSGENEEGNVKGMGVFSGKVKKFPPIEIVPHMGWNTLLNTKSNLFTGVSETDSVYFAHSYCIETNDQTIAETRYIIPFSASLQNQNFFGVQFHPEKSGSTGQKIIENFLSL